jgi:hypothetical protein
MKYVVAFHQHSDPRQRPSSRRTRWHLLRTKHNVKPTARRVLSVSHLRGKRQHVIQAQIRQADRVCVDAQSGPTYTRLG